jgi:hypothetical protein
MNMSKTSLFWLLVAVPLAATGCTHASAKTTPETPALDMPAPPPRDVEPAEAETPPPPVPAPTPAPVDPSRGTPARPRPPAAQPSTPPAPQQPAPPPAAPPAPQPSHAEPPAVLQAAPATAEGETERGIRAVLVRANTDLSRVDYRTLNADARTQYDTAKRFARQADDAMRAKNLVFAKNMADKAAALAAQLAGR